jgi:hypothetical protein
VFDGDKKYINIIQSLSDFYSPAQNRADIVNLLGGGSNGTSFGSRKDVGR